MFGILLSQINVLIDVLINRCQRAIYGAFSKKQKLKKLLFLVNNDTIKVIYVLSGVVIFIIGTVLRIYFWFDRHLDKIQAKKVWILLIHERPVSFVYEGWKLDIFGCLLFFNYHDNKNRFRRSCTQYAPTRKICNVSILFL